VLVLTCSPNQALPAVTTPSSVVAMVETVTAAEREPASACWLRATADGPTSTATHSAPCASGSPQPSVA